MGLGIEKQNLVYEEKYYKIKLNVEGFDKGTDNDFHGKSLQKKCRCNKIKHQSITVILTYN